MLSIDDIRTAAPMFASAGDDLPAAAVNILLMLCFAAFDTFETFFVPA